MLKYSIGEWVEIIDNSQIKNVPVGEAGPIIQIWEGNEELRAMYRVDLTKKYYDLWYENELALYKLPQLLLEI